MEPARNENESEQGKKNQSVEKVPIEDECYGQAVTLAEESQLLCSNTERTISAKEDPPIVSSVDLRQSGTGVHPVLNKTSTDAPNNTDPELVKQSSLPGQTQSCMENKISGPMIANRKKRSRENTRKLRSSYSSLKHPASLVPDNAGSGTLNLHRKVSELSSTAKYRQERDVHRDQAQDTKLSLDSQGCHGTTETTSVTESSVTEPEDKKASSRRKRKRGSSKQDSQHRGQGHSTKLTSKQKMAEFGDAALSEHKPVSGTRDEQQRLSPYLLFETTEKQNPECEELSTRDIQEEDFELVSSKHDRMKWILTSTLWSMHLIIGYFIYSWFSPTWSSQDKLYDLAMVRLTLGHTEFPNSTAFYLFDTYYVIMWVAITGKFFRDFIQRMLFVEIETKKAIEKRKRRKVLPV